MFCLGLDISTTATGVSVIEYDEHKNINIKFIDAILFNKCKTFWQKTEYASNFLNEIKKQYSKIDLIGVEEPLMGFKGGASSAKTITQLMRFNGIVSYIALTIFNTEPVYVNAAHARKLCGMKLLKTAVGGPQKEQVFNFMKLNDLSHINWPLTKSGKICDHARDATDSYVIAKATVLEV